MSDRERHLERLLGTKVRGSDGRMLGRIEEIHAEPEGEYYVVTAFDIGPIGLLERLSVRHLGWSLPGRPRGYRATWEQIDLVDEVPQLLCDVSELRRL